MSWDLLPPIHSPADILCTKGAGSTFLTQEQEGRRPCGSGQGPAARRRYPDATDGSPNFSTSVSPHLRALWWWPKRRGKRGWHVVGSSSPDLNILSLNNILQEWTGHWVLLTGCRFPQDTRLTESLNHWVTLLFNHSTKKALSALKGRINSSGASRMFPVN